jgi:NUMOD3 motif
MHIYRYPSRELLCSLPKLPFFYVIQHRVSGKLYAGYKGKKPDLGTFMTNDGYMTSSGSIKYILKTEGIDSFIIRRIRLFDTYQDAFNHEISFLSRIDAMHNLSFFNKTNGHPEYTQTGRITSLQARNKLSKAAKGKKQSPEWIEKRTKKIRGIKRTPEQIEKNRQAKLGTLHSDETKRKMSESHRGVKRAPFTEAHRKAISEGNRKRQANKIKTAGQPSQ